MCIIGIIIVSQNLLFQKTVCCFICVEAKKFVLVLVPLFPYDVDTCSYLSIRIKIHSIGTYLAYKIIVLLYLLNLFLQARYLIAQYNEYNISIRLGLLCSIFFLLVFLNLFPFPSLFVVPEDVLSV